MVSVAFTLTSSPLRCCRAFFGGGVALHLVRLGGGGDCLVEMVRMTGLLGCVHQPSGA